MRKYIFLLVIFVISIALYAQDTYFKNPVEVKITEIDFGDSNFYPADFEYHYDIDFFKNYFENYATESDYSEIHYNYDTYPILISGTLTSETKNYKWTYNEGGWGTLTIEDGTQIILVDPRFKQSLTDSSFNFQRSIRRNTLKSDIRETQTFKFLEDARTTFFKAFSAQNKFPDEFVILNLDDFELVYFISTEGDLIANKELSLPETYDPTKGSFYRNASSNGAISDPYPIFGENGEEILVITISYKEVTNFGSIVLAFDIRLDKFQY